MWCPLDFTPPTDEAISKTLSETLKSFISSVKGSTILLKPLTIPLKASSSSQCCPKLLWHFSAALRVDHEWPFTFVLEPEWLNDSMLWYSNPGCTFNGMYWPLQKSSGGGEAQKMLFFEFTWPERRKCSSSENRKSSRKSGFSSMLLQD